MVLNYLKVASATLCMMSGQSSSPVMQDTNEACEDLGQNYLKADIIIQSLAS